MSRWLVDELGDEDNSGDHTGDKADSSDHDIEGGKTHDSTETEEDKE